MGKDPLLGAFEELVLLAILQGGGRLYGMEVRREIERRTGRDVAIGAVYATLDRMEKKGWVTRKRCSQDRRRVWCTITRKGLNLLDELDRPIDEIDGVLAQVLSEDELSSLLDFLDRIRARLGTRQD